MTSNTNTPMFAKEQKDFEDRVARYEKEKADIKKEAEALEKRRDECAKKGGHMALAVSVFSVSIAMASICMVTKKKPLWFISMILAAYGISQMICGWYAS